MVCVLTDKTLLIPTLHTKEKAGRGGQFQSQGHSASMSVIQPVNVPHLLVDFIFSLILIIHLPYTYHIAIFLKEGLHFSPPFYHLFGVVLWILGF